MRLAPPVINTTSVSLLWLKETKKNHSLPLQTPLLSPDQESSAYVCSEKEKKVKEEHEEIAADS